MTEALLLVSFGGPEGPDDVAPFLANVTRGRQIPAERLAEVAGHYLQVFGGVSPINEQCRELVAALQAAQDRPVYWGNRNWHPMLSDTLAQMRADGVDHAYAIVTSCFPSYSGCRQYQEDIAAAQVGGLPAVTKIRHYYAEDGFVGPLARNVRTQLGGLHSPRIVFTAHSIPVSMARGSGPDGGAYVEALRVSAEMVMDRLASPAPDPVIDGALPALPGTDMAPEVPETFRGSPRGPGLKWDLVFQSRSGPPHVPWLEPDVGDHLERLYGEGVREVVLVPIGFTSDHVEVVYDLDVQAVQRAAGLPGLTVRRAATVGTDPAFVAMLVSLVEERRRGVELASHGPVATHDRCPRDCCPSGRQRAAGAPTAL